MDEGYIHVNRDIQKHWIWSDATRLKWWLDLLMMAATGEESRMVRGQIVRLECGQIVAGSNYLAGRWCTSKRTVIRFLYALEIDKMIVRKMHPNFTIISVVNFREVADMFKIEAHPLRHPLEHPSEHSLEHHSEHPLEHPIKKERARAEARTCARANTIGNLPSFFHTNKSEEIFEKLKQEEIWIEQVAMKFGIRKEEMAPMIDDYKGWTEIYEKDFASLRELKIAFVRWYQGNIRKANEKKQGGRQGARRPDTTASRKGAEPADSAEIFDNDN